MPIHQPTIFISRKLPKDSPFLEILTSKGYTIIDESLLEFAPVPFSCPKDADWLFFYSKKGVEYFFETAPAFPERVKFAALGEGTAQLLAQYIEKVDFVGEGHPETVAENFKHKTQNQKICFVQAKNSQQSVQKLLVPHAQTQNLVVYDNIISAQPLSQAAQNAQILVFTSPLNVEAFAQKAELQISRYFCAAIGNTTAKKLVDLGHTNPSIAENPSEMALAELILKNYYQK